MRRLGFTLIELLVVIAIIAILAAIIFPVAVRAKWSAHRSSDLSNMNSIRTALQLYRTDQGAYPPALLGYVTLYTGTSNIMPANEIHGPLYSKRIDSLNTFKGSLNRVGPLDITTAVWPNQDPRAAGSAPLMDLNGDGTVDNADDPANARQAFGPTTTVQRPDPNDPSGTTFIDAEFYKISSYDVSRVPISSDQGRFELRYALHWTTWGLAGGNRSDDPRQLGYSDPPENSPVTWNSYFRDYPEGVYVPRRGRNDIVLFLGGSAKSYDSLMLHERSWRVLP